MARSGWLIGGGASANAIASRKPYSMPVTTPESASALASGPRSDQSFSVMNASAELGPWPENEKPATVTMFSTVWCGYCKRLKLMLDKTGIGYTVVDIEDTPGTEELVKSVNGGNAVVPTLVFPDGSTATNPTLKDVQERLSV